MSKLLNPVEYFELSQSAPTRLLGCFHVKPSLAGCGAPSRRPGCACLAQTVLTILTSGVTDMGAVVTGFSRGPFLTFSGIPQ